MDHSVVFVARSSLVERCVRRLACLRGWYRGICSFASITSGRGKCECGCPSLIEIFLKSASELKIYSIQFLERGAREIPSRLFPAKTHENSTQNPERRTHASGSFFGHWSAPY